MPRGLTRRTLTYRRIQLTRRSWDGAYGSLRAGIVEDRIEPREYLSITATFDHDITDGAPAARFAQVLKEYIERGHGLLTKE